MGEKVGIGTTGGGRRMHVSCMGMGGRGCGDGRRMYIRGLVMESRRVCRRRTVLKRAAQLRLYVDEGIQNRPLSIADVGDMVFQTADPSGSVSTVREQTRKKQQTHSRPASPVRVASRDGFSNKHSRPVLRQRLQGGLSAPSHLIFCFLQAFCEIGI